VKALAGLLTLGLSGLLSVSWPPWQPSSRQHTAAAVEAWEAGDYQAAAAALEEALALEPDEPLVRYNAGTGRLATGQGLEAARILSQAAGSAEHDLAPDLLYNLGNAFLELGETGAALEAYKETLRREPSHRAAKHNLELALQDEESPRSDGEGGDEGAAGGEESSSEGPPSPEGGEGGDGDPGQASPADEGSGPPAPGDDQEPEPLPGFQDQEDMSAEQAAALLEAVEALEREQRRERAAQIRRQRALTAGVEKDW
jgi:tetratricopeptide (TPR) repeat protein